jgi:hypothetical protein
MELLLLEKSPTDGKETQVNLVQPNFQLLKLFILQPLVHLLKQKSTQMVQPVLFHKKLINNMMVFHNSRNHLTSVMQKSQMTLRIFTTQMLNRIQVFYLMLKLMLIQMLPSELLETTTKMLTMLTFQEIQFLSKNSLEQQL